MKYFQLENVVDTLIFLVEIAYLVILLKKYRYNSFLTRPDMLTVAKMYWNEYINTPVNEGLLLWIISVLMWIKAVN